MNESTDMNRRGFLASAAGLSLAAATGNLSGAGEDTARIKLGLIGCGRRGTWIADLFVKHGGYELWACADYFADRSAAAGIRFGVPGERQFATLSAYKRLLESGVEAVAIESPPYFHPEQAAAAVEAGLHVYLAKPMAVDVPGCQTVLASGKAARAKKQCFLIDFQTRANGYFIEAIKRVHDGALGAVAFGEASYHADCPWYGDMELMRKDLNNPENRLIGWGVNVALSGDIIVEQNIHTLDVMNWIMKVPPLSATGTAGRKVRPLGDCSDHYACVYQYPDRVGITFSSRQFKGHGMQPEGIRNRMFGAEGALATEYGGQVVILGDHFYQGGKTSGIYGEGAAANIATFYDNIKAGNYDNVTVEPSVQSNLVSILGREAARRQTTVTWEQLMKDAPRLEYDFKGLKR